MEIEKAQDLLKRIDTEEDTYARVWIRALFNVIYIISDGDNEVLSELRSHLGDFPDPSDWEQEAARRLFGSKSVSILKKAFTEENAHARGFLIGFFISIFRGINTPTKETEEWANEIDLEQSISEYLIQLGFVNALATAEPEEVVNMLKGFQDGTKAFFDAEGEVRTINSASPVYMALILNADKMGQFKSVQEFYDWLKSHMGNQLPHDFESFKKICYRIGFRGSNYASRSS